MAISSSAAFWSPGWSTLDEKKGATVPSTGSKRQVWSSE
jgi:hypothetical protein